MTYPDGLSIEQLVVEFFGQNLAVDELDDCYRRTRHICPNAESSHGALHSPCLNEVSEISILMLAIFFILFAFSGYPFCQNVTVSMVQRFPAIDA